MSKWFYFKNFALVIFNPKIGPYLVLPLLDRVDLGAIAIRGTPHSPKLEHYWSLTSRLFSVISKTLMG